MGEVHPKRETNEYLTSHLTMVRVTQRSGTMEYMPITAHDVAAAVVERHHPIDQLKLQKIVFYAAGEYSALTGAAMFPEPIEAWDWGPAIYDLWTEYHHFEGDGGIVQPESGESAKLNALAIGCVESALAEYGERTGANLIELTHLEPAWKDCYVAGQRRTVIPLEILIQTFRAKFSNSTVSQEMLDQVFARPASA